MILKSVARSERGYWIEIGEDHLATLMGSEPADHLEGGLIIYRECETSGKIPIIYKLDDPIVFALRADFLVDRMRPFLSRLKESTLKDKDSTHDHAQSLRKELSDFSAGLKWAAQCTKPKEKKK
jgi:hypothetical protein